MRKSILGEYWRYVWSRYGRGVLDQSQIEWIVKAKTEGRKKNEDIADAMEVSVRRVQRLYSCYRRTGAIPTLKVGGRPRTPDITPEERAIVREAYQKYRLCACYLEKALRAGGIITRGYTGS